MIDCEFKKYWHCTDDCDSCNYAKTLKQQQELDEAVQVAKAAICKAFEPVLNAIDKVIKKLAERKNRNEKH